MYIIVDTTAKKHYNIQGSFPWEFASLLLDKGHNVYVVSLYSHTVKIPFCVREASTWDDEYYPGEWEFEDAHLLNFTKMSYAEMRKIINKESL